MSIRWKTVRVFISSTFRDMHAERDHLVKVVFPALRERLEKYRIYLVDIDLRWGVTREQAENDQALDVCLQQIDECRPFFLGILGERYGWVPTRYPADALKRFGWIQHHTGKSLTELEILHGVLQDSKMRGRAFFYFRDPVAVRGVPEAVRRDVYVETESDSIRKLEELKRQIRFSGYPMMENYSARWDAEVYDRPTRSKGRLVDLEAFGERVQEQLWDAIKAEHNLRDTPSPETTADPLAEEQDHYERFMESRLRVYVGRDNINDAMFVFADGNAQFPCLVTGPSGSGKSAALARFVRDYRQKHPQVLVIPHFIGASPRSTNLCDMLRRYCQILKARFGFAEDVPEEVAKLSITLREFVGKVPADTRILLLIDALNQLDEADRAQELNWLPKELPPQVKVIVSCIRDSGKTEPVLEAFHGRKHCPVQLTGLNDAEQREIIRQVPSLSAKTLDDDQVRLLLSNPATANPLFLLVALEELRGFAPYERLNERIAVFPREGDTVTAIFTQVIERLAEEFNRKLVETVLTLLASARRGLSERELQELVDGLDGADDLFPVLRQLRPYLLSRAGLIDFYHRNLFKAVRERYLPSEEQQWQAHVRLAEYFDAQDYWLESLEEQRRRAKTLPPTPRPANVRKVDELPWQLLQTADWQRSEQLLTDLAFLEAKVEAGMVFELVADFSAVIGVMPVDRLLLRILRLLEEALRRDIHFMVRHPTTLFQCMWNSCWWYDCPEAIAHYEAGFSPATSNCNRISELLEEWHSSKREQLDEFPWLRCLKPPSLLLGSPIAVVLAGHSGDARCVSFSPDGSRLISCSDDGTIRLWSVRDGTELLQMRGATGGVTQVCYSSDGKRLMASSKDGTSRVWDAETGKELLSLRGHDGKVNAVAFTSTGRIAASVGADGTARVWCVVSGKELNRIAGHESIVVQKAYGIVMRDVLSVCFTKNDEHLLTTGADNTIRLWDWRSGKQVFCARGHGAPVWRDPLGEEFATLAGVNSGDISHGRGLIVSAGKDKTVRIWDAVSGMPRQCYPQDSTLGNAAFSPDGSRVAVGAWRAVRIIAVDTGELVQEFFGHEAVVHWVAWSPNGQLLASCAADGGVRIWTVNATSATPAQLKGHRSFILAVAQSPDGQYVASGGEERDKRLCLWSTDNGHLFFVRVPNSSYIAALSFSPDSSVIAVGGGGWDGGITLWSVSEGVELRRLAGHKGGVQQLLFTSDGRHLISRGGELDKSVRVWDVCRGIEMLHLAHKDEVGSLAVSSSGELLASGSGFHLGFSGTDLAGDCSISVWDMVTGVLQCQLVGHSGQVGSLAFSPDGELLLSGSKDGSVRLWSIADSKEVLRLAEGDGEIVEVGFFSSGAQAYGLSKHNFSVWDVTTGECKRRVMGSGQGFGNSRLGVQLPLRAHDEEWYLRFEDGATGDIIGWFPSQVTKLSRPPDGSVWAGLAPSGHEIAIIQLEGRRATNPESLGIGHHADQPQMAAAEVEAGVASPMPLSFKTRVWTSVRKVIPFLVALGLIALGVICSWLSSWAWLAGAPIAAFGFLMLVLRIVITMGRMKIIPCPDCGANAMQFKGGSVYCPKCL